MKITINALLVAAVVANILLLASSSLSLSSMSSLKSESIAAFRGDDSDDAQSTRRAAGVRTKGKGRAGRGVAGDAGAASAGAAELAARGVRALPAEPARLHPSVVATEEPVAPSSLLERDPGSAVAIHLSDLYRRVTEYGRDKTKTHYDLMAVLFWIRTMGTRGLGHATYTRSCTYNATRAHRRRMPWLALSRIGMKTETTPPAVARTLLRGPGLRAAVVGRPARFWIDMQRADGSAYPYPGDWFEITLRGDDHQAIVVPRVQDLYNGTYEVTYTLREPGAYRLHVWHTLTQYQDIVVPRLRGFVPNYEATVLSLDRSGGDSSSSDSGSGMLVTARTAKKRPAAAARLPLCTARNRLHERGRWLPEPEEHRSLWNESMLSVYPSGRLYDNTLAPPPHIIKHILREEGLTPDTMVDPKKLILVLNARTPGSIEAMKRKPYHSRTPFRPHSVLAQHVMNNDGNTDNDPDYYAPSPSSSKKRKAKKGAAAGPSPEQRKAFAAPPMVWAPWDCRLKWFTAAEWRGCVRRKKLGYVSVIGDSITGQYYAHLKCRTHWPKNEFLNDFRKCTWEDGPMHGGGALLHTHALGELVRFNVQDRMDDWIRAIEEDIDMIAENGLERHNNVLILNSGSHQCMEPRVDCSYDKYEASLRTLVAWLRDHWDGHVIWRSTLAPQRSLLSRDRYSNIVAIQYMTQRRAVELNRIARAVFAEARRGVFKEVWSQPKWWSPPERVNDQPPPQAGARKLMAGPTSSLSRSFYERRKRTKRADLPSQQPGRKVNTTWYYLDSYDSSLGRPEAMMFEDVRHPGSELLLNQVSQLLNVLCNDDDDGDGVDDGKAALPGADTTPDINPHADI